MPEVMTGTPPAAAPATPPPAAPTPPTPPPGSRGAAPVSQPAKNMDDAYSQLDAMAGVGDDAPEVTMPDAGDRPTAPDTTPAKPADKPATPPAKPLKASDLRTAYEASTQKLKTLEKELAEVRAKAAPDWDKHPEKVKLTEGYAKLEKRAQELDEQLRFTKYEASEEYKVQYEKPFFDAYAAGVNKVAALKVTDPATGDVRQATRADFDSIMGLRDDDAAAEKAFELFGAKASIVMYHRERVQGFQGAAEKALETYRKEGQQREASRAEAMNKARAEVANTFHGEAKAAIEKYPQWFKAAEGDAKGAEILENGFKKADVAFGAEEKDPETGRAIQRTPVELAKHNAAIRNKAGGFDYVVYLLNQQKARAKELEKKLKQYENSEPGGGEGGRKPKTPMSTWDSVDAQLSRLAK